MLEQAPGPHKGIRHARPGQPCPLCRLRRRRFSVSAPLAPGPGRVRRLCPHRRPLRPSAPGSGVSAGRRFCPEAVRGLGRALRGGRRGCLRGGRATGTGIEETARRLRYAFLERTAEEVGADVIATAHNADDNVETLLLHLIRGSGLQGLTGIRPRRGALVRPLLTTTRAEILDYLAENALTHVEDSTNADTAYARNKLRREVIPLLRELNPRLEEGLTAAMTRLRADNDYLTAQALSVAREAEPTRSGGLAIPAAQVGRRPDPIAVRVVSALLGRLGEHQFRAAHLTSVVALSRSADPSGSVDLPHGLTARRAYGLLLLEPANDEGPGWTPVPSGSPRGDRPSLSGLAAGLPPRHGAVIAAGRPIPVLSGPGRSGRALSGSTQGGG